jgi:hypothetical protein
VKSKLHPATQNPTELIPGNALEPPPEAALDIARRIADGLQIQWSEVSASDPALALGLNKLQRLAQSLQGPLAAGRRWGHLQQLELAGTGGFGEVYRAFDSSLDRTVALKLRRVEGAAGVAQRPRFRRRGAKAG